MNKCCSESEPGTPPSKPTMMRQVAPGVWIDPARCRIAADRKLVLLDDEGYAQLGLKPAQQKSIYRLFEAGKITIYRVTPRVALLDAQSWLAHLKTVADDPWYWETPRHLDAYRGTYREAEG